MNRFERLRGASRLVAYIDLKSPYAFIAIEPTRAVARAAGVTVEWRPFTLDIPSYLGSARLDREGNVVENRRSATQWSGVRYAYRDARRYARLAGRILRGTEKIWDSSLAGIGLLWAQRHGAGVADRYLDESYRRFWQRDLDIEDPDVVARQLTEAGADVGGFAAFAAGEGRDAHEQINAEAFAAGIFGVPTYLVADECWFGREHLPRVAWLLEGRAGPAPDLGYPVPEAARLADAGIEVPARGSDGRMSIRAAIDIRDPRVWLAWHPVRAAARDLAIDVDWVPYELGAPVPPPGVAELEDRGTAHRRYRAEHAEREVVCYAAARGLELRGLYRRADARIAHLGLLWARGQGRAEAYLERALEAFWSGRLDPDDAVAVAGLIEASDAATAGFPAWAAGAGPDALADLRMELQGTGVFQVPTLLLGPEPFQGRAHLPLLRALLAVGVTPRL